MMTARALALLLTLTACGASGGPTPAGDAGDDTANGCPARHIRIGAECISALDTACGPRLVRCGSGTSCALVAAGDTLTPEDVRCVAD